MKNKIFAFLTALLALLIGCNSNTKIQQNLPSINVEQLSEKLETDSSLVLLDVRTEGEFDGPMGHLENAILIPVQNIKDRYTELEGYKDKEIIVYCRSGNRSSKATSFLREKGYNATNLEGGMIAWNKMHEK
jgi:rhodanese-related sulfurtransferase